MAEPDSPGEVGTLPSVKLAYPNVMTDKLEAIKAQCFPFRIAVNSTADPVSIIAPKKKYKDSLIVFKFIGGEMNPDCPLLQAFNPFMNMYCYCLGIKDIQPVVGHTYTFKKYIGFLSYFPLVDLFADILGKLFDDIV